MVLLTLTTGILEGKQPDVINPPFSIWHSISNEYGPTYDTSFSSINPARLLTVTPANIEKVRSQLIKIIFGYSSLPKLLPDTIYEIHDEEYNTLEHLAAIERFEITQDFGIQSIGYIFRPKVANNKLLLYHQGHQGDFLIGKETIAFFVDEGFTIYAFCMPLLGKNNQPYIEMDKLGVMHMNTHDRFKFLENPISYFITPVISMINYASDEQFDNIIMVGLSGGGWTTTLAAAVDTRINYSFPVAGTYPMFIRFEKPKKNYGDFEQSYPELYKEVNYLDMYILGSVGTNRLQLQVLNLHDPCCFDERDFEKYESTIKAKVREYDSGSFGVFLETENTQHSISKNALQVILQKINAMPGIR